ncbi:MAG: hypothetical protein R2746_06345 [Acidimicrobiales bacterium]
MDRLRPYPVSGFAALTLFIWGNRIWLAWTNPEDTVAEKLVWSTPITLFVLAALAVGLLMLRGVDRRSAGFVRLVRVFAGGTVLYWAVRTPMILLADHPGPFKVVHAVLALVSVLSAALALRSVGTAGAPAADEAAPAPPAVVG